MKAKKHHQLQVAAELNEGQTPEQEARNNELVD